MPPAMILAAQLKAEAAADRARQYMLKQPKSRWSTYAYHYWLLEDQLWWGLWLEPWGYCKALYVLDTPAIEAMPADALYDHLLGCWSDPKGWKDHYLVERVTTMNDWAKRFPALAEFLSTCRDAKGRRLKTATFRVWLEDDGVRIQLHDREDDWMLWGTCCTFDQAYEVANALLADPNPQWRKNRYSGGDSGRVSPKAGG